MTLPTMPFTQLYPFLLIRYLRSPNPAGNFCEKKEIGQNRSVIPVFFSHSQIIFFFFVSIFYVEYHRSEGDNVMIGCFDLFSATCCN